MSAARLVALAGACAALAGCGDDGVRADPSPPAPPTSTTEPVVVPLAAGRFRSGVEWRLTWETVPGRTGALCVAFADAAGDVQDCTRSSSTWFVGTLRRGARHVVYGTLPCGVTAAELRRAGRSLDVSDTVAADDASVVVLEAPAALGGVVLVARAHDGRELFTLPLDADPLPVAPATGC